MHLLHVIPPFGLLVDLAQVVVQAVLSEVFEDDILTSNPIEIILYVVRCTVLSIGEALFVFKFLCASWAAPSDKAWLNLNVTCKLVSVFVELFDEVEGTLVV